jgi:hypothetical protein
LVSIPLKPKIEDNLIDERRPLINKALKDFYSSLGIAKMVRACDMINGRILGECNNCTHKS